MGSKTPAHLLPAVQFEYHVAPSRSVSGGWSVTIRCENGAFRAFCVCADRLDANQVAQGMVSHHGAHGQSARAWLIDTDGKEFTL